MIPRPHPARTSRDDARLRALWPHRAGQARLSPPEEAVLTHSSIYAYDYDMDTGDVRARRVFTTFDKLRGLPDGATVDEEGYLWSAEVYSGRLIRFDPNGVVDRIVGLPVKSTTSVIFGGADLDIAYVTSMARPMDNEYHREREAGCLFAVHGLGVRGLPESRFAG